MTLSLNVPSLKCEVQARNRLKDGLTAFPSNYYITYKIGQCLNEIRVLPKMRVKKKLRSTAIQ